MSKGFTTRAAGGLLALVDLGADLGLYPADRADDPMSLAWIVRREVATMKALRKALDPTGKAVFDRLMKLVNSVDWETVDPKVGMAVVGQLTHNVEQVAAAFATKGGPIVGKAAAGVYGDIRRLVSGKPSLAFDALDKAAIKWIQADPNWWIKEAFGPKLSAAIQQQAEHALIEGLGRKEMAGLMEARLGGMYTDYRYWDVLSSATLNRSRAWGAVRSWDEDGFETYEWVAVGDERMCFVEGTPVSTPRGAVAIDELVVGDEVDTPAGPRRVTATMAREFSGKMTAVVTDRGVAVSTHDHPYLVGSEWTAAEHVIPGCRLHTADDKGSRVLAVFNFALANPNGSPPDLRQGCVALPVLVDVLVPIVAVDLDCDADRGQGEIDGPMPHLCFLYEPGTDTLQRLPDDSFDRGLAPEPSITRDRAKAPVLVSGDRSKGSPARFARDDAGRSSASFGTVSVAAGLRYECAPATLALDVPSGRCSACARTGSVSVRDTGLDCEHLATDGTELADASGSRSVVASTGAVDPAFLDRDERGSASATLDGGADYAGGVVASARTEPSLSPYERLAAAFAIPVQAWRAIHDAISTLGRRRSAIVFDITVENQHVFYASGVLVHNCPTCGALDGTRFSVGGSAKRVKDIVEGDLSPDEFKTAAPWVSVAGNDKDGFTWSIPGEDGERVDVTDEFGALSPGKADDGGKLADLGIGLPPVHGRCRCTAAAI